MLPRSLYSYLRLILPGEAMGLVLYAVLYPLRRRSLVRRGLRSSAPREWSLLVFFVYCGAIGMLTLTPPCFNLFDLLRGHPHFLLFHSGSFGLKLFSTFRISWGMVLGNVLLFIPFPFAAATLWRGWKWYHALALALGITVFIESWQHFVGRMTDVDDLLLNTVGGVLGWLAWLMSRRPALHCEDK